MNKTTYDRIGRAIHETFSSIFSLDLEILRIEHHHIQNPPKNISGFVVLRNPDVQGTLSIGFPHATALKIFSGFYGTELLQIDERVLEGVGEITNMVYGTLKKHFNEIGFNFELFIPFIVIGNEFNHLKEVGARHSVTIHFKTASGEFWTELNMKKTPSKKKKVSRLKSRPRIQEKKKSPRKKVA